jgi:hypothetical protein
MALLSIPFAFVAGNRGATTGVGISLGIAIAYTVFEQSVRAGGDLNQLPAAMAAWSPELSKPDSLSPSDRANVVWSIFACFMLDIGPANRPAPPSQAAAASSLMYTLWVGRTP